jgi:hypothetical protein
LSETAIVREPWNGATSTLRRKSPGSTAKKLQRLVMQRLRIDLPTFSRHEERRVRTISVLLAAISVAIPMMGRAATHTVDDVARVLTSSVFWCSTVQMGRGETAAWQFVPPDTVWKLSSILQGDHHVVTGLIGSSEFRMIPDLREWSGGFIYAHRRYYYLRWHQGQVIEIVDHENHDHLRRCNVHNPYAADPSRLPRWAPVH